MSVENQVFDEPFYGYKMNADGTHTGSTNPFRDSDRLQLWIKNWVEVAYELRVTDAGDSIVMQIVQGRMIFPPDPNNLGVLVWDKEKKDWAIEAPPPAPSVCAESLALFAAARVSKDSSGKFMHCIECQEGFSDKNVFTDAGKRETQISGLCGRCFDNMFKDEDEEGDGDVPT